MRHWLALALLFVSTPSLAALSNLDKARFDVEENLAFNGGCDANTTKWATYNETQTVTITNASPGVFTSAGTHGFAIGQPLIFTTSNTLPTGLTAGTTYYVSAVPSSTTYQVSATLGGASVNTSSNGSGTHTQRPQRPLIGSGGTATMTLTASTTSALDKGESCIVTKDANDRAGEGAAYSFTIPRKLLAKPVMVTLDYEVASGTYATGSDTTDPDLEVYAYGPTDGTPQLYQLAPYKMLGLTSGTTGRFQGRFQTASSGVAYRLILHEATSSTSAYTVRTRLKVSGESKSVGPAATDWIAYTPTGSWVANTAYSGLYRRVGDSVELQGSVVLSGTPTSAQITFSLPSGLTIDTSKLNPVSGTNFPSLGVGAGARGGVGDQLFVTYSSTTAVTLSFINSVTTAGVTAVDATHPSTWASGDKITFNTIPIPIVGWSSNTVMSSDSDGRIVQARYGGTASTVPQLGSEAIIKFATQSVDTHAAYSTSTGSYTVPVPGKYRVYATVHFSSGSAAVSNAMDMQIWKNGVAVTKRYNTAYTTTSSEHEPFVFDEIDCLAGDTLSIAAGQNFNGTTITLDNTTSRTYVTFDRISGLSAIAAAESISARYFSSSSTPGTSGSANTITFSTKDFDSHNGYSGGTYTIQSPGKYQINAGVLQTATTTAANQLADIIIRKNGTAISLSELYFTSSTSKPISTVISDVVNCVAGDLITIAAGNDGTTPAISASNFANYFSITRVGN